MTPPGALLAGVELGGTKSIAVLARDGVIVDRCQWPTENDPAVTLGAISQWLADASQGRPVAALGIASFGPLCVDRTQPSFGRILNTPKPGWSNADVVTAIACRIDAPVTVDTDVAGAALAEGRWGAAVGCPVHVYLTIGTGIGGGIVINDQAHHGAFHPEIGHLPVRRRPGDDFAGICPFHGDCLEGLASGPAIAARTGQGADQLAPTHPIWAEVAREIADVIAALMLTLSPNRIVIGGGVGHGQPLLLPLIQQATVRQLGNYLPGHSLPALEELIVPPSFGADAGVYGSIALAIQALEQRHGN